MESLIEILVKSNVKITIISENESGIVYEFEREYKPNVFFRDYVNVSKKLEDLDLYDQDLLFKRFKVMLKI